MNAGRPPCLGCLSDAQPVAPGVATMNAFVSAFILFAIDPAQVTLYVGSVCDRHAEMAANVIALVAAKNGLSVAEIVSKLEAAYGPMPEIRR